MKKTLKRIVSLFLVCLMVFSAVPAFFAAAESENVTFTGPDGETYNHYPQVCVAGFGVSCVNIYYEDDPEQKPLFWPFDTDRFINNLANIDDYIVKSIKDKEPDVLHTIIYNYLMDCFGMLALNPDGSMMEGVTTEPVGLRYAGDGKYDFYFDSRVSPLDSADILYECIQQLREETGAEKIELVGSSHGANVVTAYMYSYPEELKYVDTVLMRVPSVGGVNFVGELFSGNFTINPKALCDLIDRLSSNKLIPDFLYLMEEAGILEIFLEALVIPVFRDAVYEAVVDVARDFVATLPTAWVCIPDEYFLPSLEFIYGPDYDDPSQPYAQLIADMKYYHYNVANRAEEIFAEAMKENEDLHVAFITKYGTAGIPLTTGDNVMEDGFVTIPVSSFGATCANYGEKLPADYVQQKYTDYDLISPEWNIDASTGVAPFTTWYLKGIEHSATDNVDYLRLNDEILYKNLNIYSDPEFPQYLTVSEDAPEKLEPLVVKEKKETFYDKIYAVFKKFASFARKIFDILTLKFLDK